LTRRQLKLLIETMLTGWEDNVITHTHMG